MVDEPEVVPDKLKNPLDYRILIIIGIAGFVIQITLLNLNEDDAGNLNLIMGLTTTLIVSISAFVVSKRYSGSMIFGRAYLAYGLGYMCYFIGESLYYTFDLVGIEPYPSIADVFYFLLYPFSLIHLILNIRFFNVKISNLFKILLIVIPLIFVVTYSNAALTELEDLSFDFYYGLIFIIAASSTLSFAIFGASVFRQGLLGIAWLLLVCGILLNAVGDVWYYYLEIFGLYDDFHVVNVLWFVASFTMIYALYKHQKAI